MPRLRRGLPPRWAAPGDELALDAGPHGGIDALQWRPAASRPPGPGEVSIDVHAAGLNFRDLMWGMGLLPEEALIDGFAGPTFGLECAGIVREVGPGVTELAVGDRVAGFAPAALATRVTTPARTVTRIPDEISFAAAATIPVTFVTAVYALGTLGKLAAGEVALIHAAAGGVGLAAIQYAKLRGATVIATAGSEIKRAFLRLAGADHVLDFARSGIYRRGAGDHGRKRRRCRAEFAQRRSDGAEPRPAEAVRPLSRTRQARLLPEPPHPSAPVAAEYFLFRDRRGSAADPAARSRRRVAERDRGGAARRHDPAVGASALSVRRHRRRLPPDAGLGTYRQAGAGARRANAAIRLRQPSEIALRADGTYLVTGGVSGFGFEAARWLAAHGAGAIALLGRRGVTTPGAGERLAELRALGADARIYAADVADQASLAAALDEIRRSQLPLRGVIHAASAIADGLAADLDDAAIRELLRPKLGGAILLDRLTRADPIEMFVLFSSATTLLGAPGQGVYVAANLALEAVARQRRAEGLPALAVAWGPIEDAGYLAERPETRDALARRLGAKPIPAAQALAALPAMLASDLPAVAYAETSWSEARRFLPILAAPLFAEIRDDEAGLPRDDLLMRAACRGRPRRSGGAAQDRDRRGSGKHPAAAVRRG